MAFKGGTSFGAPPKNPEALYSDLPHRPDSVPGLWSQQTDILRQYWPKHVDTSDLALELPTGTGKTVPGLLIAEWVRRVRRARAIYACPTRQLARQVHQVAIRESIPAVVLAGSHRKDWVLDDRLRYEAGEAVAITTYSSVFNSSPKLLTADLLLFDDAHAGEQYVGEQYAVGIGRRENIAVYALLLEAVAPALDGMILQRLRDASPDPGAHHQVRLVVPLRNDGMVAKLDAALATLEGDQAFRYSMIRGGLSSCLVYVSYSGILIRPLIPPTSDNSLFVGAHQRLYLSATLGSGGELERAFGRSPITRLTLPDKSPTPRSGRRFFVFLSMVEDADPVALAREIVALTGKALVLTPDGDTAAARAAELAQPGWPVMTIGDVEKGMEPFAKLRNGTCGLASRYDGLDLPGDDCRVVVLEGTPNRDTLQERFLSVRVRAQSALAERVRTRVVQGAGRCTRGPNDWAVVVVLGEDLTGYLLRPETLYALDPEMQAEIQFGVSNSRDTSQAEVLDNVRMFLAQGEQWRTGAEPLLLQNRQAAVKTPPPGTAALADAVGIEIEATSDAWAKRWADAGRRAQDAARKIHEGGDVNHGYRALWTYLAAVWTDQAGVTGGDAGARLAARTLIQQAEQIAKPGTWLRELPPLPDVEPEPLGPEDTAAVAAVVHRLTAGFTQANHDTAVQAMREGLGNTEATLYEAALAQLGTLLGAEAGKPEGTGRCDALWSWANHLWIALEAKSEQKPVGLVSHRYVRQANDQLRLLAADRGVVAAPLGSVTVIVSPRPGIETEAAKGAEDHVHLVHPNILFDLLEDTQAAWRTVIAQSPGRNREQLRVLIATTFGERGLLPTQVRDRLTSQPVAAR
ncbi:DEAD/DEAH box helicase [Saccharothrix xinjiangensis]|uniref:DEAD/DEAH box helicase n=1 Tax=Saccharothrix xinjiangensis TaxID=204798 RepID=A0ABV9Y2G4_9PSEU